MHILIVHLILLSRKIVILITHLLLFLIINSHDLKVLNIYKLLYTKVLIIKIILKIYKELVISKYY